MNRSITAQPGEYLPSTSDEQGEGTITCCICQAVYMPARSHAYLLQGPPIALESALMSMCHFCFRCRRPSCPACWDDVHGVCGQCTEETCLPFRHEAAPLDGMQLVPSRSSTTSAQAKFAQSSLVNVRPGRFQRSSRPSIDSIPTRPDFVGPRQETRTQRPRPLEIDEIVTRPDQKRSPAPPATITTRPERSGRRRVGRTLPLLVLALVILLTLLLVAALLLPNANTFLRALLHIDIRTEFARFWHMTQHLF